MSKKYLLLLMIFAGLNLSAQQDTVWNVMILKKGVSPEIKDNMAVYSPSGFYLYQNCFYDLKLRDKTKRTLRLVNIKQDTLVFIGIANKSDTNLRITSKDTVLIQYNSIDKILLVKDWSTGSSKKINCDDHYFIFYSSLNENKLESKYKNLFTTQEVPNELVPRLSSYGITYHFEYAEKLHYHSGIEVQPPKYTDEEKVAALKIATIMLDLVANKQINISLEQKKRK